MDDEGRRFECSSYSRGGNTTTRWYEIDASGTRIFGSSLRPPTVKAKKWAKMSEERKLAEIIKHSDAAAADVAGSASGTGDRSIAAPSVAACAPMGLLGFNNALASTVIEWSNTDYKLQDPIHMED